MITTDKKPIGLRHRIITIRFSSRVVHGVDLASQLAAPIGVVMVLLVAAIFAPVFYNAFNVRSVLIQFAVLGIIAIGQTIVLLVRSVDLSVGSVMALGAVIVIQNGSGSPIAITIIEALILAVLIGLANGFLITKRQVPPFVATFGMMWFIQGARMAYTNGQASGSIPKILRAISITSLGVIPAALVVYLIVTVIVYFFIRFTSYGRWIYAVGGNPAGARYSGLHIDGVVIAAHIICSILALLGGLVLSGYIGYVDLNLGTGYNLNSIAAAIIGGTMFSGGKGNIFGTAAGVLLMVSLTDLLVVLGLQIYWQYVVQGLVLITAMVLQGFRQYLLTQ